MAVSVGFLLVLAVAFCAGQEQPRVETTCGHVEGKFEKVPINESWYEDVEVYWGIPYAQPPIMDLRFRRPVPASSWKGVRSATKPPNSCFQVLSRDPVLLANPPTPISEDCLYLNIWAPKSKTRDSENKTRDSENKTRDSKNKKLSTMVWLTSELLTVGSATIDTFNGAKLAASQDVIVVSINYRLGPLGFMYVGTEEAPGNMGLVDITLALKWIKENIERFGGDKDNVTLFGQSTGATAVSLMLFSPLTENLFNGAIIQSGLLKEGVTHQSKESALQSALDLAVSLNCNSSNISTIVHCLQQVPDRYLMDKYFNLILNVTSMMTTVVDGYFLTQEPFNATAGGYFKRTNILVGSTHCEGTYIMESLWPGDYDFRRDDRPVLRPQELETKLKEFLGCVIKDDYVLQVLNQLKVAYEFDKHQMDINNDSLDMLNAITGDFAITCPLRNLAAAYANVSQDAYVYQFKHRPDNARLPPWTGMFHTSELPLVFGTQTVAIPSLSQREKWLSEKIMIYWATFAKSGNPNRIYSESPVWPRYNATEQAEMLQVTESAGLEVVNLEDTKRCTFWDELPRSYLKY